jgi:hypothetical protein
MNRWEFEELLSRDTKVKILKELAKKKANYEDFFNEDLSGSYWEAIKFLNKDYKFLIGNRRLK